MCAHSMRKATSASNRPGRCAAAGESDLPEFASGVLKEWYDWPLPCPKIIAFHLPGEDLPQDVVVVRRPVWQRSCGADVGERAAIRS